LVVREVKQARDLGHFSIALLPQIK